jgi:hypothetical protein
MKRPVFKPETGTIFPQHLVPIDVAALSLNMSVLGLWPTLLPGMSDEQRCLDSAGIEAFHRLVDLVMGQEPYRSARRVFWVTDNGSSHRGQKSIERLSQWYPHAIQAHTPVHASWLNQIEIYFSVVQRKVLTPSEFPDLVTLERRLLEFQSHYEKIAKPFKWKFTRDDLNRILSDISYDNLQTERLAA